MKEYLYHRTFNKGAKELNEIAKKNVAPERFVNGFSSAEFAFQKAISLIPDRDESYHYLGTMYIDYINADFDKKLAISEDTGLSEDIAEKKSIENLEKAISLNPYNVDAHFSLAWIYEHTDRSNESDRIISEAEGKWEGKIGAQFKLLEWAVYRKNTERIKNYILKIYEINPGNLTSALNIVWRVHQDYEAIKDLVPAKAKAREIFARFLKGKKMNESAIREEEYARTLAE